MSITYTQVAKSVRANCRVSEAELHPEELNEFINQAIDFASSENLLLPIYSEVLLAADGTYEYALSSGELLNMKYIYGIWESTQNDGNFDYLLPANFWKIESGATPYIRFDRFAWMPVDSTTLRVVGAKPQPRVTDPDDIIYLPAAYVIWKATAIAHLALGSNTNSAKSRWHDSRVGPSEQYCEIARIGAKEFHMPMNARVVLGRL